MDRITLRITLNDSDWDAYLLEATKRVSAASAAGMQKVYRWLPSAFVAALSALAIICMVTGFYGRIALAALLAVVAFTALLRLISRGTSRPFEGGVFLGPAEVGFDATGMHLRMNTYESFAAWTNCAEVSDNATHIFVWIDRYTAQVIPLRELPDSITAPELVSAVRTFIANRTPATSAQVSRIASADAVADDHDVKTAQARLPGVGAELLQLVRLFVLTDARPALLQGRDLSIALLGLLALGTFMLFDRLREGADAQFFAYDFAGLTWFLTIGLALAGVIARLSGLAFRRVLLLVAGLALLSAIAFGIGGLFGVPGLMAAAAVIVIETFMFLGRGLTLLAGKPQRGAFAAGALLLAGSWYLNDQLFLTPSFWLDPEPDLADEGPPRSERDQLAYEQALRVEASLGSLERATDQKPRMFFLGFAGHGGQRVFAEEIGFAAERVAERYGTNGRSVRLVNDRRDRETYPWATVSALRHALRGVALVMDVERDVLFLSLSSHGAEDGTLSVNDGMAFTRDLQAAELAAMLRESGIKWKIIVVSACHAGSFLDDLRDDYSVVLTAAASDRASFGCSDDRDLTYFGEAFYRDALPLAKNLRAAFDSARAAIEMRERAEGMRSSNPQAHFGAQMERKLSELEAVLAER